jgi:hypothetical protein
MIANHTLIANQFSNGRFPSGGTYSGSGRRPAPRPAIRGYGHLSLYTIVTRILTTSVATETMKCISEDIPRERRHARRQYGVFT